MRSYHRSFDMFSELKLFNVISDKSNKPILIRDIHIGHGGEIFGVLLFESREVADKMARVMRLTKTKDVIDWRLMDKIKSKFNINYIYREVCYGNKVL